VIIRKNIYWYASNCQGLRIDWFVKIGRVRPVWRTGGKQLSTSRLPWPLPGPLWHIYFCIEHDPVLLKRHLHLAAISITGLPSRPQLHRLPLGIWWADRVHLYVLDYACGLVSSACPHRLRDNAELRADGCPANASKYSGQLARWRLRSTGTGRRKSAPVHRVMVNTSLLGILLCCPLFAYGNAVNPRHARLGRRILRITC
jgi:hypothetical protein